MARIAVTSCVYLGDVAPYIPIARRLAERGHEVVFVAPEGFRSLLATEAFAFHPYAMDCSPATMNVDPEHTRLMRRPMVNVMPLGRYWMNRAFADDPDAAVASLKEGFAGADAVVTHPTMGAVTIPVARSMGIATVAGQLFPMMIPTDHWTPPVGSRSMHLPAPLNRVAWKVLRSLAGRGFRDDAVNAMRASLGLEALRGNAGWAWLGADATVVLVSPHYFGPGATDWPPVTWGGFSIWTGPAGQQLSDDLAAYVEAGDPLILVTLGTSAATNAGEQFAAIGRDLDRLGLRSVMLVGHAANLHALRGREGVAAFAPMTEVVKRCRVAVVSGALGGIATALAAGVPVVVHPQLFDQIWHGRRVEQLGVGVMARRTSQVAAAAKRVADDPGYSARARALADRMAAEDGAATTADLVERMIGA